MIEILLIELFSGLSLFGGSFTILSYILFPSCRSPSQVFALWLAISSLGYGIIPFIRKYNHYEIMCQLTGYLDNYFYLVAIFTTTVIANCMKTIFLSNSQTRDSIKLSLQPKNYLFVWILPLFLNILPFSTNNFNQDEDTKLCGINTDTSNKYKNNIGFLWMGVILYIPFLLCFLYNVYIYSAIWQKVKTWKVSLLLFIYI